MTTVHPTPSVSDETPAGPTRPADLGGPPRFRNVVGAACMPLMVLALLATGPLDPFDDQARASVQLGQLSGHVAEVKALGLVELLAGLLFAGVVLAFAGHTRGRTDDETNREAGRGNRLRGAAGRVHGREHGGDTDGRRSADHQR